MEDQLLQYYPSKIGETAAIIAGLEADLVQLSTHPLPKEGFVGMKIRGNMLTDKENAGAALLDVCKETYSREPVEIGNYRGFMMAVSYDSWQDEHTLILQNRIAHRIVLGKDARGNLTRMENVLSKMPERLKSEKASLVNLRQQQAAAQVESKKQFPFEKELSEKTARLIELDMELNLDGAVQSTEQAVERPPSVLTQLKAAPVHDSSPNKSIHSMEVCL